MNKMDKYKVKDVTITYEHGGLMADVFVDDLSDEVYESLGKVLTHEIREFETKLNLNPNYKLDAFTQRLNSKMISNITTEHVMWCYDIKKELSKDMCEIVANSLVALGYIITSAHFFGLFAGHECLCISDDSINLIKWVDDTYYVK